MFFQDFGFFKSPEGERSYDAIGLLKQVGEQTAATYENAQELLKNDTPKAVPEDASGNDNSPSANNSKLTSNALVKLNLKITVLAPSMLTSLVFHAMFSLSTVFAIMSVICGFHSNAVKDHF